MRWQIYISLCCKVSYLLAVHCGNVSLFLLENPFPLSLLLLLVLLLGRHVLLCLDFSLQNIELETSEEEEKLNAGSYFPFLGQWGWLMIPPFRQHRITSSEHYITSYCLTLSHHIIIHPLITTSSLYILISPHIIMHPLISPHAARSQTWDSLRSTSPHHSECKP